MVGGGLCGDVGRDKGCYRGCLWVTQSRRQYSEYLMCVSKDIVTTGVGTIKYFATQYSGMTCMTVVGKGMEGVKWTAIDR